MQVAHKNQLNNRVQVRVDVLIDAYYEMMSMQGATLLLNYRKREQFINENGKKIEDLIDARNAILTDNLEIDEEKGEAKQIDGQYVYKEGKSEETHKKDWDNFHNRTVWVTL